MPDFFQNKTHSENCELCSTSTFQKESHLSNLRLKNFDKAMLSDSFQKCEDNNSPYKRVCFTSQLANYYVIYIYHNSRFEFSMALCSI